MNAIVLHECSTMLLLYHLSLFVFNSFKSFIKIYTISNAAEINGILNKILEQMISKYTENSKIQYKNMTVMLPPFKVVCSGDMHFFWDYAVQNDSFIRTFWDNLGRERLSQNVCSKLPFYAV